MIQIEEVQHGKNIRLCQSIHSHPEIGPADKNIEEYCKDKKIEKIYAEKYTGTKIERPQFSQLLKIIHPGDTIIFDSVSRMSRTAEEGYNLYMQLLHQGVDLMFIKEPHINTEYYKRMQNRKYEIAHTGKNL